MAYSYEPFEYQRTTTPQYDSYMGGYNVGRNHPLASHHSSEGYISNIFPWQQEQAQKESTAFQDYAGDQFKGLFDMVNAMPQNPNPLSGFSQAPMYSPLNRSNYESDNAFQDARFGNINNYLSSLGSFLGNMGGGDAGIAQAAAQRASHRASMPTIGMSQPMGMPQMGGNPALSGFGGGGGRLVGQGWGSHPSFKGLLAGGGE